MLLPFFIFSTHDRHRRVNALGPCDARTYYHDLDPDTDSNFLLVVYATFVLECAAECARCLSVMSVFRLVLPP